MIEIIWYREIFEKRGWWEHWYEIMSQYEIIYKENHQHYLCKLENDYGDCSSGRTSATRGGHTVESIYSNYGELHYKANETIILEKIEDFISVSKDWWDERYPMGWAYIKEEFLKMFHKTLRGKDVRQVYLFQWWSGKWKSYLWRKSDISVYETDSNKKLPKEIADEIIVLWNKYPFTLDEVKERIIWEHELIQVFFE